MSEIDEIKPNLTDEKPDTAVVIAKTAIRTVFWLVTAVALFCTLFVSLFPYPSMKLYTDLGLSVRALETGEAYLRSQQRSLRQKTTLVSADLLPEEGRIYYLDDIGPNTSGRFMRRGKTVYQIDSPAADSKYVAALTNSIGVASELMFAEADLPYAEANVPLASHYADKLAALIEDYASVTGIESRNAQVDRYNLDALAPARRPSFYSYRAYLETLDYQARLLSGETDRILIGAKLYPLTTVVNTVGGIQNIDEGTVDRYINFFNQFTAYLDHELWTLGGENMYKTQELGTLRYPKTDYPFELLVDPQTGVTYAHNMLKNAIEIFKPFVLNFDTYGEPDRRLKQLYYVRTLARFTDRMFNAMTVIYSNRGEYSESVSEAIRNIYAEPNRVWEYLRLTGLFDESGNDMTLTDYYNNRLLPAYVDYAD